VRAGPARRRRDARLGGIIDVTWHEHLCKRIKYRTRGASRRVWLRRRHRRREKSTDAITWSRRLFLSSPLGTMSVPTLSLSSPQASCRLAFAALTTHSVKLAACRSRACPDRSPRPRQQNRPRSCCLRRSEVEDTEIQVGRGDTGSALVHISTRAASSKSLSFSCVPPIRREQS
jgi:hypothetical protein